MKRALYALLFASVTTQAAAVGRLADLTIHDRTDGRALPVYWHDGKPWVVGKPGNEYQVKVRNQAGQEVLAVISVDGVNVISGDTASPEQTGYIVDAWRTLDVKGWRKSLQRTAAFYFTALPDSYAARTGRPDNVGVIGAALFRRKPVYAPPPPPVSYFESTPQARDSARAEGSLNAPAPAAPSAGLSRPGERADLAKRQESRLGTGHGRSEYSQVRMVDFERATDHPEEVISVFYDSYANLVTRGIIPPAHYRPREPHPFPQRFAPDPQG